MLKQKKIRLLFFSLLVILNLIFSSKSFASNSVSTKYFGLYNQNNSRLYQKYYSVVTDKNTELPIYKIVEYSSNEKNSSRKYGNYQIFSLKSGINYGKRLNYSGNTINCYTNKINLNSISLSFNDIYQRNLPRDINNYNKLIWILENIEDPSNSDKINNLLESAGITSTSTKTPKQNFMTKKDGSQISEEEFINAIEVVEQCAIWSITNESGNIPKIDSKDSTKGIKSSNKVIQYVSDDLMEEYYGNSNDNPMIKLYRYFINGADEAVGRQGFQYNNIKNEPEFDTSRASVTMQFDSFYIGPYTYDGDANASTLKILLDSKDCTKSADIVDNNFSSLGGNSLIDKINNNKGNTFYIKLPKTLSGTINVKISTNYTTKELNLWTTNANTVNVTEPIVTISNKLHTFEKSDSKVLENPQYDFALRMYITDIERYDGTSDYDFSNRKPKISDYSFTLNRNTTIAKNHSKTEVSVNKDDIISMKVRVYNEGNITGRASEVNLFLPEGITLTTSEENSTWRYQGKLDNGYSKYINMSLNQTDIKAYEDKNIDYKDLDVECKVIQKNVAENVPLKVVSEIGKITDTNGTEVKDRDSNTNSLTSDQIKEYKSGNSESGIGYEDDDDYENLIMTSKYLDFALRMYIYSVNGQVVGNNGDPERKPKIDLSPLNDDSDSTTTANYYHTKKPLSIVTGDIIVYNIVVFNEGTLDGYVSKIVNHLPPELEFISDDKDINAKNGWTYVTADDGTSDLRNIKTNKLNESDADNLIKKFNGSELDNRTIQLKLKVKDTAKISQDITDICEITEIKDQDGNVASDKDDSRSVNLPAKDSEFPDYRGSSSNKEDLGDSNYYYKGQEDDDDFEKVVIEEFDLALKQFISAVNGNYLKEDNGKFQRAPTVDTTKYGTTDSKTKKKITTFDYNFGDIVGDGNNKTPVRVCGGDQITYSIRVYNEGTKAGFADAIKYTIPTGLQYVKNNSINDTYGWQMYNSNGEPTDNEKEAKYLITNKLSKQNNSSSNSNLIKAFNPSKMQNNPSYLEVELCLKVTNLDNNSQDRIVTSTAEIYKMLDEQGSSVNDIDSSSNNGVEGKINEDDEDLERIYIKYFDLSLKQWTKKITTIDEGKENSKDTDQNETTTDKPVVKLQYEDNKVKNTVVKFVYNIRIYNNGEIPGTASEISDYVPDGLIFNQADNPNWIKKKDKVITETLKNESIEPGQYRDVELVLTWDNSKNYMRKISNVAEITKDYNSSNTQDINSTPDNKIKTEDDYDYSITKVSSVSGSASKYIALITIVIIIITIGLLVIIKVVLK